MVNFFLIVLFVSMLTLRKSLHAALVALCAMFAKWHGNYLLHLIKDVGAGRFLLGDIVAKINGWLTAVPVNGRVIPVADENAGWDWSVRLGFGYHDSVAKHEHAPHHRRCPRADWPRGFVNA